MADIIGFGDKHKRIFRIAEKWFRGKVGASNEVVHADLRACGNATYSRIYQLLCMTGDKVKQKYQAKVIKDMGAFLLWIIYKDTAYRDIFLWILYQILKKADVWMKEIEPYLKEPEDWYVNAWNASMRHTKEGRERGDISAVHKADDESIFTPPEQKNKLNRY